MLSEPDRIEGEDMKDPPEPSEPAAKGSALDGAINTGKPANPSRPEKK